MTITISIGDHTERKKGEVIVNFAIKVLLFTTIYIYIEIKMPTWSYFLKQK